MLPQTIIRITTDNQGVPPLNQSIPTAPLVDKDVGRNKGINRASRWTVGLSLAPDVSRAQKGGVKYVGQSGNLLVEYRVTSRLSLASGLYYARKLYSTTGAEYKPPKGFWTNRVVPDQVEADCRVLDLPLLLRYEPMPGPRSNWFVTGGLSSYWMLEEKYEYLYQAANDPDLIQNWQTKNRHRHLLAGIHLSGGYQWHLGRRFSLQAEPYLKVPLSGVGFGKIKLYSTGLLFSLKYRIAAFR